MEGRIIMFLLWCLKINCSVIIERCDASVKIKNKIFFMGFYNYVDSGVVTPSTMIIHFNSPASLLLYLAKQS